MKFDGFIEEVWNNFIDRVSDHTCPKRSSGNGGGDDDGDAGALGVKELAGIFVLHGSLLAFSFLYALARYFCLKRKKHKGDDYEKEKLLRTREDDSGISVSSGGGSRSSRKRRRVTRYRLAGSRKRKEEKGAEELSPDEREVDDDSTYNA